MAQSRVHKIGTIYSRVTGLLTSGALQQQETPLWYILYKTFPPKYEPRFDRQEPFIPIKKIFYKEDLLRARFHKEYPKYSDGNLLDDTGSTTAKFIAICAHLEERQVPENSIYRKALRELLQMDPQFSIIDRGGENNEPDQNTGHKHEDIEKSNDH